MKITLNIYNGIANCEDNWDSFLPENHHLKSSHLQAFENAAVDNIECYYAFIFNENNLIGIAYFQQFNFQQQHINFGNSFRQRLLKTMLPPRIKILVCGNLFRINFQGFYFEDDANNNLIFEVIKKVRKDLKKPCAVLLKDCLLPFENTITSKNEFHFFEADVTMEIKRRQHWQTFDDYLCDLHKKYLQRAKKILKAFEDIEIVELNENEIIQHKIIIEKLYSNVVQKQSIKLGIVNANYFYELKKDLKEKFEIYAMYKSGTMVGFYTFIYYETDMETHYIGLDYEANKLSQLYFNILFLGIKKMIEKKYNSLELGRTAKDAKENVGAVPRQIFNYIFIKNIFAQIALNYFLKKFSTGEKKVQHYRHALK